MKPNIHPQYVACTIKCSCGSTFVTRATVPEIHLDICSKCHPFYTGKQKLLDTEGRVERFRQKYGKMTARKRTTKKATAAAAPAPPAPAPATV